MISWSPSLSILFKGLLISCKICLPNLKFLFSLIHCRNILHICSFKCFNCLKIFLEIKPIIRCTFRFKLYYIIYIIYIYTYSSILLWFWNIFWNRNIFCIIWMCWLRFNILVLFLIFFCKSFFKPISDQCFTIVFILMHL